MTTSTTSSYLSPSLCQLQETSVPAIEDKIGCGQVEQLIDQAERELALVSKMEEWKPWEISLGETPPGQWSWP